MFVSFVCTEDSKENDIEEDLYDDISAVSCSSLTATTEIDEETKQKEKLKPTPSSKATALARHRAAVVAVTEADLQRISIYDIVLPIPGTDVIYPDYLRSAYAEACRKYTGLELCDICVRHTALSRNCINAIANRMLQCVILICRVRKQKYVASIVLER